MCSSLASSAESKMTLFIALPFFFRLDELTCFVFLQLYLSANDPVNIDESFFLIDPKFNRQYLTSHYGGSIFFFNAIAISD